MSDLTLSQPSGRAWATGEDEVTHALTVVFPTANVPVLFQRGLTVGREWTRSGLVLDDRRASRAHLEVRCPPGGGAARARDLDSKNGSWLNGAGLTTREDDAPALQPGDVLRVGDTLMVYSRVGAPPRELTADRALETQVTDARVAQVARGDLPVLVRGPSGAGKERVALAVHAQSGRGGPFVPVNCATFTDGLLASELFGHVAGAFSGAGARRDGLFVSARGGTLFLDEIAELPLAQQPALLRALQERRVRPVGADREVPVDVRVVAATHQDLEARVEAGAFRGDLFARLAGAPVDVAPLAARRADILPLLRTFLDAPSTLDADAAEALLLHDWTYNVRALQHVAAALRTAGLPPTLTVAHLPPEVRAGARARATAAGPPPTVDAATLEAALKTHAGRVSDVADALGLTRQQVYRRLRRYGLQADDYRA